MVIEIRNQLQIIASVIAGEIRIPTVIGSVHILGVVDISHDGDRLHDFA